MGDIMAHIKMVKRDIMFKRRDKDKVTEFLI
jgi:hypothetical protein